MYKTGFSPLASPSEHRGVCNCDATNQSQIGLIGARCRCSVSGRGSRNKTLIRDLNNGAPERCAGIGPCLRADYCGAGVPPAGWLARSSRPSCARDARTTICPHSLVVFPLAIVVRASRPQGADEGIVDLGVEMRSKDSLVLVRKRCFSAISASDCGFPCAAYRGTPPRKSLSSLTLHENPSFPYRELRNPHRSIRMGTRY